MLLSVHNILAIQTWPAVLGLESAQVSVSGPMVLMLMLLTAVGVWCASASVRFMQNRKRWHAERAKMQAEHETLQDSVQRGAGDVVKLTEYLAGQKAKTEAMHTRSRILEKILAISPRLNTTRNHPELLDNIVAAVEEIMGFRRVVLHIWAEQTQAFEARAFAGVRDEAKASLIGIQVTRDEYDELTAARHRYSNCFLLGCGEVDDGGTQPVARGSFPRDWTEDHLLIVPLISPDGQLQGYLSLDAPGDGQVPGVVEIRQLEFLVQQAATALESSMVYDTLARQNAELSMASEKLGSLARMKANIVSNVSHELRTPLTSISGYAELLQNGIDGMGESVRTEFLQVIRNESKKLSGIVDDLIELGTQEHGRPALKQVNTDLVGSCRHLVDSWTSRAMERNIKLRFEPTSPSIVMAVDEVLIQQMMGHLLSNAFKFTPEGGRVTLKVMETGTAVRLVVEDTGIGIPEDQLGVIFDKFHQADASETREHNGQGVGLAICHDIVSHHDGRIWAENLEPAGARLSVLLPRRPEVVQPVEGPSASGFAFEPGEFMQRLMHWVCESLGVERATLMMPDPAEEVLTIRAAIGLPDAVVQSTRLRKGVGISGQVWASRRTLLVEDVTEDARVDREWSESRYSTPSLLCVPLIDGDDVVGVMSVNNKTDGLPLDMDDRIFLESLAPGLASMLIRYRALQDEAQDFDKIRETLRRTTAVGHMRHESLVEVCQEICLSAARAVDLPRDELEPLAFALQFYDVGFSCVPPQLLNKRGPLDGQEARYMQKHVGASLEILGSLRPDPKVRQTILYHHENFDGTGYPTGLAGEAIPRASRLLRLADALAALLSPRPWRPAFDLPDAVAEIRRESGTAFCPRMVEVFLGEVTERRARIEKLQASADEIRNLKRPVLDTRGMMTFNP